MKKIIAIGLMVAFVFTVAASSFARTLEEEKMAVRNYLTVIDAKIIKARKAGNKAKMTMLQAEKKGTLARWYKLQAEMQAAPAPVAPAPVAAPAPAAKAAMAPMEAGMGVCISVNGGLDAGLTGFAGNLDYDLSSMVAQGLKVRVGANYVSGTNPTGSDSVKAASAKIGAIYDVSSYLSALGLPLSWYVGGAYLIPVKVNNSRTGKWGAEAYVGANYMIPEMGMVNVELGYGALKYADNQAALKGVDLKVGYGYSF
jgi:hypothetical protein